MSGEDEILEMRMQSCGAADGRRPEHSHRAIHVALTACYLNAITPSPRYLFADEAVADSFAT
jgi:hypothetical protein